MMEESRIVGMPRAPWQGKWVKRRSPWQFLRAAARGVWAVFIPVLVFWWIVFSGLAILELEVRVTALALNHENIN
jgi:hypothetical protein